MSAKSSSNAPAPRREIPPDLQVLLRARAERLRHKPEPSAEAELAVLTFTVGGDRFGLGIDHISHVVEAGSVRALPGAPSFLLGIANIRAEILPIIDLRELLGLPRRPLPQGGHLIVAQHGDRRPAFRVDSCGGILRIRDSDCGKVPATLPARARAFIRFFTPDGLLVLHAESLLAGDDILINT